MIKVLKAVKAQRLQAVCIWSMAWGEVCRQLKTIVYRGIRQG